MLFTSMLSFFDSVEHSHPPFRHRLRSRRNGQSGIQTRRLQDRPSRRKQTSKESSSRSNLYRDLRQTRRTWNAFVSCLASSPIIHVSLEKNFDKIGTGALTFSGNSLKERGLTRYWSILQGNHVRHGMMASDKNWSRSSFQKHHWRTDI